MSYKTPKALVESPAEGVKEHSDVEGIEIQDDEPEDSSDDATDVEPFDQGRLALRWQGYSRTDLQEMWRTALKCRDTGKFDEAENMLSQAFVGLGHVMGKTNSDTVRAAYNLADLYAQSGRMEQANDLLEKVIQNFLETYGCKDSRTQQNTFHAIELLNSWNRELTPWASFLCQKSCWSLHLALAKRLELTIEPARRGKPSKSLSQMAPS